MRRPQEHLLGADRARMRATVAYGSLVCTISGRTDLPSVSPRDTTAVSNSRSACDSPGVGATAQGHHVGDQDDNFGGLKVGLVQARLEHRKIVRRADGHELSVRLRQGEAFGGDLLGHLLIELLQVLFMYPLCPTPAAVGAVPSQGRLRSMSP